MSPYSCSPTLLCNALRHPSQHAPIGLQLKCTQVTDLPFVVGSGGVSLVQVGGSIIVKADDEGGQTKWTPAVALCVFLVKHRYRDYI